MIPTSTNIKFDVKAKPPADESATVIFLTKQTKPGDGAKAARSAGEAAERAVERLIEAQVFQGKAREVCFDLYEQRGAVRRIFVVALGTAEKLSPEILRQSAGAAAKALAKHRQQNITVILPDLGTVTENQVVEAIVTGFALSAFDYREYKGTAVGAGDDASPGERKINLTLVCDSDRMTAVRAQVNRAAAIAEGQNFCRTIASRPGNDINPPTLAEAAQRMAREVGLTCKIMDEKQLEKLGMGGILAVGAGSIAAPPRMIVLEHNPVVGKKSGSKASAKDLGPLLVVGKAITFDTGGISIKPADKMGKMIFDKCGGMAVLGLMYALAKLKSPQRVVGILSSAENAISSRAYRPGDILRMYNGVTVEVTNTDAEGRLVLGDALAWGIEAYKPRAVVDLATLTGGVIVALGKTMAGVMSNSDELVAELTAASEAAGEKIWRLPLGDDQRDYIKSECADIVNSGGREGHPLQGGAFLSFFVPRDNSLPWAHLDIAGVADTEKDLPYYGKGATGWGVRTLVNWVETQGK